MKTIFPFSSLLLLLAFSGPLKLEAQAPYSPAAVSADDYARAQGFLGATMNPLVYGTGVRPNWVEDGRFWYRNAFPGGSEFILVDPADRTRERAFDHERLARILSQTSGTDQDPFDLPAPTLTFETGALVAEFRIEGQSILCDLGSYTCDLQTRGQLPPARGGGPGGSIPRWCQGRLHTGP